MKVNDINITKVTKLLKDCPEMVQQYVKALEETLKQQRDLTNNCLKKLRDNVGNN